MDSSTGMELWRICNRLDHTSRGIRALGITLQPSTTATKSESTSKLWLFEFDKRLKKIEQEDV
jgi:hypothetical protein